MAPKKIHTRQSLYRDLKAMEIDPHGILVVHSSYKALRPVAGGPETVLDALIELMRDGLLVLPTHSWDSHNLVDNIYDPDTEPSCVGILTNLFRKRPGVRRSLHPTHSVAVLGRDAEQFIARDRYATTPCPPEAAWGQMYELDAQILFLGCDLNRNTFLHGIEERCNIPQRLQTTARLIEVRPPGEEPWRIELYGHHCPGGDVSANYGKLLPLFLQHEIARQGKIGNAVSVLCRARSMGDMVIELLSRDPDFFVDQRL